MTMFKLIGDRLNELKFNIRSHESPGSIFDQVSVKRDEDGIIRSKGRIDLKNKTFCQ